MLPVSDASTPASNLSRVVLPAPFSPSTTTRDPRSMARSTSVNTSSDPYDFDSAAPSAASCHRPQDCGKRMRATLSLRRSALQRRLSVGPPAASCSEPPSPWWPSPASAELGRARPWLASRHWIALVAAPLVGLALLEVGTPPHVVDVELSTVGIQVKHPVDGVFSSSSTSWEMTTTPPA